MNVVDCDAPDDDDVTTALLSVGDDEPDEPLPLHDVSTKMAMSINAAVAPALLIIRSHLCPDEPADGEDSQRSNKVPVSPRNVRSVAVDIERLVGKAAGHEWSGWSLQRALFADVS